MRPATSSTDSRSEVLDDATLLSDVTRHLPVKIQCLLWGRAAARCEFAGCNRPLWKSSITQEQVSIAQKAHIYAFSEDGPRGHEAIPVTDLNSLENLILVCHECHQKLDKNEVRYTPKLIQGMKAEHERRIELVTGIKTDKRSHVLLYGANIGEHNSPLNYREAASALFPERYPASDAPIKLGMLNSSFTDRDSQFWASEADNLARQVRQRVSERIATGEIEHLSVFALAPQPLLILLGSLLGDIVPADIYQRHREPSTWEWPAASPTPAFEVKPPVSNSGPPALVLSLSATVTDDRIAPVLGQDASIWKVTVPQPNNDFTKSRSQLSQIRSLLRTVFDKIKAIHGQRTAVHIFPAVSVSVAVEVGRLRMPKADSPWLIYDQINTRGGFVPVLTIPYGASND
jgi:hypothetical protein